MLNVKSDPKVAGEGVAPSLMPGFAYFLAEPAPPEQHGMFTISFFSTPLPKTTIRFSITRPPVLHKMALLERGTKT